MPSAGTSKYTLAALCFALWLHHNLLPGLLLPEGLCCITGAARVKAHELREKSKDQLSSQVAVPPTTRGT